MYDTINCRSENIPIPQSVPKVSIHNLNEHVLAKYLSKCFILYTVYLHGSGRYCKVEMDFNWKHHKHYTTSCTMLLPNLLTKFNKNGSVVDHLRSGWPQTSTDKDPTDMVPYIWRLLGHHVYLSRCCNRYIVVVNVSNCQVKFLVWLTTLTLTFTIIMILNTLEKNYLCVLSVFPHILVKASLGTLMSLVMKWKSWMCYPMIW